MAKTNIKTSDIAETVKTFYSDCRTDTCRALGNLLIPTGISYVSGFFIPELANASGRSMSTIILANGVVTADIAIGLGFHNYSMVGAGVGYCLGEITRVFYETIK
jgi:hypothetical protein